MISPYAEAVAHYRPVEALIPAHWQMGSITTDDKAQIAYHRTGGHNKPPVLLLHGFQTAGRSWLRTAQALEADYDVIMPDFRGHGYSSASVQGFSLDRLTEDMAELIGSLHLSKTFVVGHSLGAEIAGRLAAAHADLVRAVVLVDPPMRTFTAPQSNDPSGWYQRWLGTMQAIKTQPLEQQVVSTLNMLPPNIPLWVEQDFMPYVQALVQFNLEVLASATFMDYKVASPQIADAITVPLLLMTGNPQRGSGATPEGIATLTAKGSQREAIAFEEAGHFIPIDHFDAFVQALRDFFQRY